MKCGTLRCDSEMASSRWLHSSLVFPWHGVPFQGLDKCKLWIFSCGSMEKRPLYDLTESIGICGYNFTFWGRRGDWILTAWWPWAVIPVLTKQYVHTYHQPRHKSLSPQWTLNQVLVSRWELRGAENQRGQRKELVHRVTARTRNVNRSWRWYLLGWLQGGLCQKSPGAAYTGYRRSKIQHMWRFLRSHVQ